MLVCKIPQFLAKAIDSYSSSHFLESRKAVVTKNLYYVLSTHRSQIPIFLDSSSWTTSLNCFVNIVLSLVDKVNIGTKKIVSVIINFQSPSKLDITQSLIQIN